MNMYDQLFQNVKNKLKEVPKIKIDNFFNIKSNSKYKTKIQTIYSILGKNGSGKTTILFKLFNEGRKEETVFSLFYSLDIKNIIEEENSISPKNYVLLNNKSLVESQFTANQSQKSGNYNLSILNYIINQNDNNDFKFKNLIIEIQIQHIDVECFMGEKNNNFKNFQLALYKASGNDVFKRLCILQQCRFERLSYVNEIPLEVIEEANKLYAKFNPLIVQRFFSQQTFEDKNVIELVNSFNFKSANTYNYTINTFFRAYIGKEDQEKVEYNDFNNLNKQLDEVLYVENLIKGYSFSTGEGIKSYFWGTILQVLEETILIDKFSRIVLYLDEIDLGLHPEWQKKIIYELVHNINTITEKIQIDVAKGLNLSNFDNLTIDIFVASHSPFIASDVPLQNIIFLDKKDGKVTDTDSVSLDNTFGANIHTLFADAFFLPNGLIGDFAKNKIQNVIDWLNVPDSDIHKKHEVDKIRNLIGIIGEPIIKNRLIELLNEKLGIDGELDKINAQIEYWNQLKQELTKNNKNA